jgi:hypothetical protein
MFSIQGSLTFQAKLSVNYKHLSRVGLFVLIAPNRYRKFLIDTKKLTGDSYSFEN